MDQDEQRRIQNVMVCSLLCIAKCVPTPYNLFTATRLRSESGLLAAKNRDGSGQTEKDTGHYGVFTVVYCKMCVHPLQTFYSYQTSFREWPLSCSQSSNDVALHMYFLFTRAQRSIIKFESGSTAEPRNVESGVYRHSKG